MKFGVKMKPIRMSVANFKQQKGKDGKEKQNSLMNILELFVRNKDRMKDKAHSSFLQNKCGA